MEHVRTVTREFATGEKAVLHLEARSGDVIVEGRGGRASVLIDAVVRVWTDLASEADDAAALVARNMEQDEHRVIVRAPALQNRSGWPGLFGGRSRVDYRVIVPERSAVRVLSRSGGVQITHIEGVVHTEALSGKLGVEDVRGDVTVVSRSGSVLIERISGNVKAEARSGRVKLREIDGTARIEARSGTLDIERVSGDLQASAVSGSLNIEDAGARVHARARAGSVRFRGRVVADVDIEAHAGSITFAVDPAYPFFLDAEASVGSVKSDLEPRRGGGPPASGGPKVRLRSHAGSIRVTPR